MAKVSVNLNDINGLTDEERDQLDREWEARMAAKAKQPVAPVAPVEPEQTATSECQLWYAKNPWVMTQPKKFTRTHFRPSVLRRRNI